MAIKQMTIEELEERLPNPSQADKFCGHYSDKGFYIIKVGTNEEYTEAIDLLPCRYEYEETNKTIV